MYNIKCEVCGGYLDFDYEATIQRFLNNVSYSTDDIKYIQDKWVTTGLCYKCVNCSKDFYYKWQQVELKTREAIAEDVMLFRRTQMFNKIDRSSIDPDNGISYCGLCSGIDGKGNCYNDFLQQCTIR